MMEDCLGEWVHRADTMQVSGNTYGYVIVYSYVYYKNE